MPAIVLLLIFGLLMLVWAVHLSMRQQTVRRRIDLYENCDNAYVHAIDARSIPKVKQSIEALKTSATSSAGLINSSGRKALSEDISDLQSHLRDLEEEDWLRKAERHLQNFADCYETIITWEFENFNDVEELFKTKAKCIREWQKYYDIDLSKYETRISPKQYLQEWFAEDYDPCMESRELLEKKLSTYVEPMQSEYKRKQRLLNEIIAFVSQNASVQRSILLKTSFAGYTEPEIHCCYRALLRKNRLAEFKRGNRYFVSLSEKETARTNHKNNVGG